MKRLISAGRQQQGLGYKTRFKQIIIIGIVIITMIAGISFTACGSPHANDADIAHLREQIKENPESGNLYVDLAQLLMGKNDNNGALAELNKALAINPSYQSALITKGYVYMQMKQYDNAIEPLLDVVELNEDNQMAMASLELQTTHYYLGDCYLNTNDYDSAISHFLIALTIDKTDSDAHYMLGVVYKAASRYEEAVIEFERAVIFVPNYTEAYERMQECYLALGLSAYANYASAMIDFSNKLYEQAIPKFQTVLLEIFDSDKVYLGLGMSYESNGQNELAMGAYENALELNPDNFMANGRYQSLQARGY